MSRNKIKIANRKINPKIVRRIRRKRRIRFSIRGTLERPRVSVLRSNRHFSAQVIDDIVGTTLASVSSYKTEGKVKKTSNITVESVKKLGALLVKRLEEKKISTVVFDRNGYRYHGIIKAFADSVREGIKF